MSIGKTTEYVTFVKNTDNSVVTFKASKIRFSEDRTSITVLSWGDNLYDWVYNMDTYYYMYGLASIKAECVNKNEIGCTLSITYNNAKKIRESAMGMGVTVTPNKLVSGYGHFVGIDDSNPDYVLYAFICQPVAENGSVVTRTDIHYQITDGSIHSRAFLDSEQGFWQPIAERTEPRWNKIFFETYPDPNVNGKPTTFYGFPYGDGESTSQGGQGDMIDTSDPIEIDSKPLLTTGDFLRVYKLTATDLTALQNKLISNGFLDNLIAKLRTDAMDYIVGLNAIPINATNVASSTIKIANLDTEINASYLSWYIEDIDFGEIALTEYFQTFMDYSPYTKLSVYIPYCGIVPLNVDNFMNDKIAMKCRIDMLTGQFVVFVSNSVGIVTTLSGNCAYQLPIRSNDYNRLVTSGLGLLGGIVGTAGALATGNIPLAIGAGLGTVGGLVATSQSMTKPDVTSKGSLGGNYGLLGNRTPYLIIQRPTISVPSDYGKTIGYMSRITAKLGDLSGYTVVEEIHLEHISATDDEKKLIENALKSGVIL